MHLQLIGTEPIELDGQNRELLIDVVVQFTRNAGAFRLLFAEQPSAQVADSVVAHAQLAWLPRNSRSLRATRARHAAAWCVARAGRR